MLLHTATGLAVPGVLHTSPVVIIIKNYELRQEQVQTRAVFLLQYKNITKQRAA